MALILDGTNGLTFNNSTVQASAGQVLQVVSSAFTTQYSTGSTTYVDSGIALSITPKFATSKILLRMTGVQYGTGQSTFARGTTQLQLNASNGFTKWGSSNAFELPLAMEYLDSPATTSSTTYRIYFLATSGGSGSYWININPNTTVFTLMEIAG
jgi:hypothetical protein